MYYYVLDGSTFEEFHKTVFESEVKYSEEEFKNIIKKAYDHWCRVLIEEYGEEEYCSYFLKPGFILWDKKFNDYVSSISDLKAIYGDVRVHVGLGITPNENTVELLDTLKATGMLNCRENCENKFKSYPCVYEDVEIKKYFEDDLVSFF